MVISARTRRGVSTLGCLVSLLLTGGVVYYGMTLGKLWWRYYELVDKMKSAARFAGNETNEQILKQLQADAKEMGLPPAAQQFRIVRTESPRGITISTAYSERVDLPLLHRAFPFKPTVTLRL
ncbi:MAG: hypothetical protein SFV24_18665 [Gemmatimonadales bacterium]|nr:hypothetical protein [Gemmatimonadota bacterium]MCC7131536.1 hypothetical protein [Gemmatimonadales bacterium]MDX2059839.1 hypothetical protein [Gemmatimonadales bacterium]